MLEIIREDFENTVSTGMGNEIGLAVSKAFMANFLTYKEDNTLSCETAKDYIQHNLRVRVDYFLDQIKHRNPPVESIIRWNAKKSTRHLELRVGNFLLTQNWVREPMQSPRPAVFRNQLQDQNGEQYFSFMEEILQVTKSIENLIYAQLIYSGYGKQPSSIILAIPDSFGNWIFPPIEVPIISLDESDIEEIQDARHISTKEMEKTEEDDNA